MSKHIKSRKIVGPQSPLRLELAQDRSITRVSIMRKSWECTSSSDREFDIDNDISISTASTSRFVQPFIAAHEQLCSAVARCCVFYFVVHVVCSDHLSTAAKSFTSSLLRDRARNANRMTISFVLRIWQRNHSTIMIVDRSFLNVMILSWGFMLMFTAFQTMGNIEVCIQNDGTRDYVTISYVALMHLFFICKLRT